MLFNPQKETLKTAWHGAAK